MRRLLTLFSVMLLSFLRVAATSDEIVVILKDDSQETTKIRPRSVPILPVRCVYGSTSASLVFRFYENLGMVSILVQNISSGEIYHEYADSIDGESSFEISGTRGTYLIRIETQDGDVYIGEFTI